jgi:hypothetical protein
MPEKFSVRDQFLPSSLITSWIEIRTLTSIQRVPLIPGIVGSVCRIAVSQVLPSIPTQAEPAALEPPLPKGTFAVAEAAVKPEPSRIAPPQLDSTVECSMTSFFKGPGRLVRLSRRARLRVARRLAGTAATVASAHRSAERRVTKSTFVE